MCYWNNRLRDVFGDIVIGELIVKYLARSPVDEMEVPIRKYRCDH